ncbi:MAG: hypothetical protein H0X17_19350, partial [Deltaproteobacteria bacterium]|nr:hypothetical protein [Deltaproteobacteria bacterium]
PVAFTPESTAAPVLALATGFAGFETRGGVLVVHRPPAAPRYVAVPNGFVPVTAMTDVATFDLLGWTAAGLVIVRLPAT